MCQYIDPNAPMTQNLTSEFKNAFKAYLQWKPCYEYKTTPSKTSQKYPDIEFKKRYKCLDCTKHIKEMKILSDRRIKYNDHENMEDDIKSEVVDEIFEERSHDNSVCRFLGQRWIYVEEKVDKNGGKENKCVVHHFRRPEEAEMQELFRYLPDIRENEEHKNSMNNFKSDQKITPMTRQEADYLAPLIFEAMKRYHKEESFEHAKIWVKQFDMRIMCDSCSTTLCNLSYLCEDCGFQVCYRCHHKEDKENRYKLCTLDIDGIKKKHGNDNMVAAVLMPSNCYSVIYNELKRIYDEQIQISETPNPNGTRISAHPTDFTFNPENLPVSESYCENQLKIVKDSESDPKKVEKLLQHAFLKNYFVMVQGVTGLDKNLWTPEWFRKLGEDGQFPVTEKEFVNCLTEVNGKKSILAYNISLNDFWDGFGDVSKRKSIPAGRGRAGQLTYPVLKLKDWPTLEDARAVIPDHYENCCKSFPVKSYTLREGAFNIARYSAFKIELKKKPK